MRSATMPATRYIRFWYLAAEFLARIEVTQRCQHAGIVEMPGRVNPIVARQAGAVGQQVAQGALFVCDGGP
jgi:hypothetical protein